MTNHSKPKALTEVVRRAEARSAAGETLTRRRFLRRVSGFSAGAMAGAPALLRAKGPNEKLNIAILGCGGRGASNMQDVSRENIVAICDVYEPSVERAALKFPNARKYTDFRRVFDQADAFDAVVVSTTEHTHAFATLAALKLRKHVYCEKPLTHNVWEARKIIEAAREAKVATQMGTQIHASDNYRRVVELIKSGTIGPVHEVHVWVSRAWGGGERPKEIMPVPPGLHWDLWLGPAPERPFHEVYFPGPKWYKWWDFGNGTMSDLGSHWIDLPFWALDLRHPLTIQGHGPPVSRETAPASMTATYQYGARGAQPPLTLTWYQGEFKPPLYTEGLIPKWDSAVLFVGQKGMVLADYGKHILLPEEKFKDFARPEPFIPKSIGHHAEWIAACKTGSPTTCNFEYSGTLTEANHLGNVAYRAGKKLEWDPVALKARNAPEADRFIRREYRPGWVL